jgi:HTH-type transcriptional regulator/antitoxin HigA
VIEPLPGTKIDGAAFWLGPASPVIIVSLRLDRIDNFWFTVFHEFKHIQNEDSLSVDSGLVGDDQDSTPTLIQEDSELRANEEAASALVSKTELESFVRRVGPLYSKQRIVQFAHRIKIHPGIIVGQLQRRDELGYSAHRDLLAKVRQVVTATALTDGWGEQIPSTLLWGT